MSETGPELGGSFALGPWRVHRAGYGAMQLAGDGVFGPPRDRDEALRVLRAAVAAGVDHIDTAQYYGPGTVNELIREALYPYPVGCRTWPRTSCSSPGPVPAPTLPRISAPPMSGSTPSPAPSWPAPASWSMAA